MDFRFSDDQLTLAESVRDYLAGTHGPEVLRRLDAEGNRDPAIWQGLVDMGLTGLLVPEAHGGLGMGLVEAALIAAEMNVSDFLRVVFLRPEFRLATTRTALVRSPIEWLVATMRATGLDAAAETIKGTLKDQALTDFTASADSYKAKFAALVTPAPAADATDTTAAK